MSKIDRDSLVYSDSGSFKCVEIYDHYVRKMALDGEEDNSYKMSYDTAKEQSCYYDEDNNFHYSWVNTEWENASGPSSDECYQELEREFEYAQRKKHLPIIVPIVEGNSECYVMPRAKTFNDMKAHSVNEKILKRRRKEITVSLMGRLQRVGGRVTYERMRFRVSNLIALGVAAGFSNEKIVSNLFWFFAENASHGLLRDMHCGNIGIYRRNLVTFDMGQIGDPWDNKTSIRSYYKTDLSSLKWRLHHKIDRQKRAAV